MPATCRPCRYYVTNTGRVIGGSEVGVLEIPEETVIQKGRLLPGKMFLIDFAQGKMVSDEEYKAELIITIEPVIDLDNVEQGQGPGLERAADGKHVPCL